MRVLRILFKVVLALVAIVVLAGVVVYVLAGRRIDRTYQVSTPPVEVPTDAEAIARGKRLVTVVAPCDDCHGDDFGGKVMIDGLAMGTLHAANLTRGRGGIGATYSDEDWVRALLHGVRKDGRSVVFMPSHDFRFTERDMGDIIAYFRSVPAVDREHPAPRVGIMARALSFGPLPLLPAELIDHDQRSFAEATRGHRSRRARPAHRRYGGLPRLPPAGSHRRRGPTTGRCEHHTGRHRRLVRRGLPAGHPHPRPPERHQDR